MWRVLCVDDDAKMAAQVAEYFTKWTKDNPLEEFEAATETDFAKASERLARERFDLVTLDLHAEADPAPEKDFDGNIAQQGKRVLTKLRATRFVPVIFYSGFADKIADLQSMVVRVVQKGENDLAQVREAASFLFGTGLPKLMRHIEQEQRSYVWDTIDKQSAKFALEGGQEELLYLTARRIASHLNRDALKDLLKHAPDKALPIELYIYPQPAGAIKTGCLHGPDAEGVYWIVATPSCDFAQKKAEHILLVGATRLTTFSRYKVWHESRWTPDGNPAPEKAQESAYNKLSNLIRDNAEERIRFLPGTFFLEDLVVDFQRLRTATPNELEAMPIVCRLDAPYREELLLCLSRYYGRLGTPDIDATAIFERLRKA